MLNYQVSLQWGEFPFWAATDENQFLHLKFYTSEGWENFSQSRFYLHTFQTQFLLCYSYTSRSSPGYCFYTRFILLVLLRCLFWSSQSINTIFYSGHFWTKVILLRTRPADYKNSSNNSSQVSSAPWQPLLSRWARNPWSDSLGWFLYWSQLYRCEHWTCWNFCSGLSVSKARVPNH